MCFYSPQSSPSISAGLRLTKPFSSNLTSRSRPQSGQLTISPEIASSGILISASHSGHFALKAPAPYHALIGE
ncbi:hypothetical protein KEJ42_01325 [Candidatus Bathyarchaeota archaeon]|nr:hypothetical protein [Candidatus Bathyarchaeota archaeon]